MSEPFLGEIRPFPFNFAPRGWAMCDGQLLPINQNQALFSLLGTTYGGNGATTFALPDLRGRTPLHHGQGPGLSTYALGKRGGEERHVLTVNELPAHDHVLRGSKGPSETSNPTNARPAAGGRYDTIPVANLNQVSMAETLKRGDNAPHNTLQPYLALNYCIALQGIFPSRE
jgi:microcystin-dependent protein